LPKSLFTFDDLVPLQKVSSTKQFLLKNSLLLVDKFGSIQKGLFDKPVPSEKLSLFSWLTNLVPSKKVSSTNQFLLKSYFYILPSPMTYSFSLFTKLVI